MARFFIFLPKFYDFKYLIIKLLKKFQKNINLICYAPQGVLSYKCDVRKMMTYTLAQVSRITDMPKSTIQKYYPNDSDSDQFHKKRREFTCDDLKNLFFIKLNLAIGKRNTFIKNALQSDDETKKQIMKDAIDSLQNCINLASVYCEDVVGEIAVKEEIERFGISTTLSASELLTTIFQNRESLKTRFDKEEKRCTKKVGDYISALFDLADEKENDEEIECLLDELDRTLAKFRPTDYSIKQWYFVFITVIKHDPDGIDAERIINCINKHTQKYRSEDDVYNERIVMLTEAVEKNSVSSNEVQNAMNEMMMLYYDEGYTEECAYFIVDQIIKFVTSPKFTKTMEEPEKKLLLKIKKANEIFQTNYSKA